MERPVSGAADKQQTVVPQYEQLNDLSSEKVGGRIIFATDDWFAVAENLLKAEAAVWREGAFTEFGKWMDGWETRRKRIPGHDWCIIQLGAPGIIRGFNVDTSYFTGNYTPRVSIQACALPSSLPPRTGVMGTAASADDMKTISELKSEEWTEILPMSKLKPGYKDTAKNYFEATTEGRWTHLRLNMYPDGGIARLRVYGEVIPDWSKVSPNKMLDLVSMMSGGFCTGFSDSHYGTPRNMIRPDNAENMGDGWETARKISRPAVLVADESGVLQIPGNDWAEFKLGHPGTIKQIEIDTQHFKGNFPDSCRIEALEAHKNSRTSPQNEWKTLLPVQKLSADKKHIYNEDVLQPLSRVSHVRLVIAPDGGVARFRVWGHISTDS